MKKLIAFVQKLFVRKEKSDTMPIGKYFEVGKSYISLQHHDGFPVARKCIEVDNKGYGRFSATAPWNDENSWWANDGTFKEVRD
jgi:hypothetical protein